MAFEIPNIQKEYLNHACLFSTILINRLEIKKFLMKSFKFLKITLNSNIKKIQGCSLYIKLEEINE